MQSLVVATGNNAWQRRVPGHGHQVARVGTVQRLDIFSRVELRASAGKGRMRAPLGRQREQACRTLYTTGASRPGKPSAA